MEGGWYAYHTVGGAITVLAKSEGAKGSSLIHPGGNSALLTAGSRQSCASSPVASKPVGRKPLIKVVGSSKEASTTASAENMDTSTLKP